LFTWQIEISVFLTFLQKTAKERWYSLVSRMGDGEEDLETPLCLPQSLDGRTFACPYADVITKFSQLDGLPIFLTHGALLARFARRPSAKKVINVWSAEAYHPEASNFCLCVGNHAGVFYLTNQKHGIIFCPNMESAD